MTLEEAIQHAEEKAKTACSACAQDHAQLAMWLRKLKVLLSIEEYLHHAECECDMYDDGSLCNNCGMSKALQKAEAGYSDLIQKKLHDSVVGICEWFDKHDQIPPKDGPKSPPSPTNSR